MFELTVTFAGASLFSAAPPKAARFETDVNRPSEALRAILAGLPLGVCWLTLSRPRHLGPSGTSSSDNRRFLCEPLDDGVGQRGGLRRPGDSVTPLSRPRLRLTVVRCVSLTLGASERLLKACSADDTQSWLTTGWALYSRGHAVGTSIATGR